MSARCGFCKAEYRPHLLSHLGPGPLVCYHAASCPEETQGGFRYVTTAVDLAGVPWDDSYHRTAAAAHEQAEALRQKYADAHRRITFAAMVGDARDAERGWLSPDDVCPDCGMEWPDERECPSCGLTIEVVCARQALERSRAR